MLLLSDELIVTFPSNCFRGDWFTVPKLGEGGSGEHSGGLTSPPWSFPNCETYYSRGHHILCLPGLTNGMSWVVANYIFDLYSIFVFVNYLTFSPRMSAIAVDI